MFRPLIVERDQAELRQKVDEPAPLELQLDDGEVEPSWDCPSVQQAAQAVSKILLLIQTLLLIASFSFKLAVLDQSLGQIKHTDDITSKKFSVCNFQPQPGGKLSRGKSMGGVGGCKVGQPSSCALTKLRSRPAFQLALAHRKPRGVVGAAGGEQGAWDRGLPNHTSRHLLWADHHLLCLKKARQVNCCCHLLVFNC